MVNSFRRPSQVAKKGAGSRKGPTRWNSPPQIGWCFYFVVKKHQKRSPPATVLFFCSSVICSNLQTIHGVFFFNEMRYHPKMHQTLFSSDSQGTISYSSYIYIYTCQEPKWPLFLIGKRLVLEGWPSKIEVSWVLGFLHYSILYFAGILWWFQRLFFADAISPPKVCHPRDLYATRLD